ncbi:hypothetical protein ACFXI6_53570, partial [Streptomyces mirabilis]|uniref:hypothetical protein n=1 Tax=Streptomyces mirabilis TaxID=68239 RepID=UPI00367BEF5C
NCLSVHPSTVLATDMVKQLFRELIEDHDQALFEGIDTRDQLQPCRPGRLEAPSHQPHTPCAWCLDPASDA